MKNLLVGFVGLILLCGAALANGTETLGPPDIAIAGGTGVVVAGTGLALGQPESIEFQIPPGATVKQVLLYWEGQTFADEPGDDTVTVTSGTTSEVVVGTLIGGPAFFFNNSYSSAFRADITGLGLVSTGNNSLSLQALTFSRVINGAGVLVIFSESPVPSEIVVRDGLDLAFYNFPEPRRTTFPQTFSFDPAPVDRTAELNLMISSVAGTASTRGFIRPSVISVVVGGDHTKLVNALASLDGEEWDTANLVLQIPAGVGEVTVEIISPDDVGEDPLPASLTWVGAVLTVPPPAGARVTGGGNDTAGQDVDLSWDGTLADVSPKGRKARYQNRYQFGGQAGANTGQQPAPRGEWTHHQQRGPDGAFVFHGGTSSAPAGTRINQIVSSDPGNCNPARNAPAKQIDFDGVGTFKNQKKSSASLSGVIPGETFHWFVVHIEDLGEPGSGNQTPDPAACPAGGRDGLNGELADCSCPDFYRITIYEGVIPEFDDQGRVINLNKSDVIYKVEGYLSGGNLQIHPPTGFNAN